MRHEPAIRKRGHQDMHIKINNDNYHSVNTDNNHNTYDTSDEDPRPAKRRKLHSALHSAPAVTPPPHLRQSSPLLPTTRSRIDKAQPHNNHGYSSTFINEQHYASRSSRSSSIASEAIPITEYQEWPFQGFLERIKIGDNVTYNLEFKLLSISEHL